ncbi:GNAT family N-acetyltransferase [Virgibacillus phasianinus]|uniref:GNAT family N-acetyltransferase n=1 Tax=Virgibacillus phasianinus TaxID=2017483 RepID=A0A220TYY4_9BACI|nr:GNAT family protein [Virgibacillus phasianinus]ASK60960.1 GNAT family N-acetyltransferase [Virgibacillus phasianinus]
MNIKTNSKRLYLREFTSNDWQQVHIYASRDEVCQYQVWGPNTTDETKEFINQALADIDKHPRSRFSLAIICNGYLIGSVELTITDEKYGTAEIGYVINPSYWGKGYATEATRLIVDWGFKEFGFHRIFATCDPRNKASARVLGKIGMVREGRIREHIRLKEGWRDSYLYSVLDREWKF